MRLTGRRKSLSVGLAVALIVNALLIALLVWSREGQMTVVELRNDGGAFRTFKDGKRVVPGGDDLREAAVLDAPERGTVVLLLPIPISTLPSPSGIDSIEVTGLTGWEVTPRTRCQWIGGASPQLAGPGISRANQESISSAAVS